MLTKTSKSILITALLLIGILMQWQTSHAGNLPSTSPSTTLTLGAPIAKDDTYDTYVDTPLSVPISGVLNNDLDPDGDTLTTRLLTTVATGTLTFHEDGSFDYIPPAGFMGVVTFTYEINDGIVAGEQKISDTEGGFTGILNNVDLFGGYTASIGDLDGDGVVDIATGVNRDDDGGNERGAVWILFMNGDGTVKSHQKVSSTAGGFTGVLNNGDYFASVDNIGDLDGDGVTDIIVGAMQDDDGGTNRGAVWVLFLNSDGTVKSHQKVSEAVGGFTGILRDNDQFSFSVTNLGDLDGDSITDIAVGTLNDDDGGTNRGAVWILFLNSDGTVKAHQKISDLEGNFTGVLNDGDQFGIGVTKLGDLNGDMVTDIAVGAWGDDDGGTNRGAIWVLFLNPDGTVQSEQKISDLAGNFAGILDNEDRLGIAATDFSDLNGDLLPDLIVSALRDDDGGTDRGSVWALFLNSDGTVKNYVKISDTQDNFDGILSNGDQFGRDVANIGDLNRDNVPDLLVGAAWDDDGGTDRGAMWVLFLKDIGFDTATVTINVRPACAASGAAAVHVNTSHSSPDLALTWVHDSANLGGYAVYRHTEPYFNPDIAGTLVTYLITGSTNYTDRGITGNPATNYYYTLRAYNCDASRFVDSNDVAEFDFPLLTP